MKSLAAVLLIFTLVKRFFNNGIGQNIPVEISDILLLILYIGFIYFYKADKSNKKLHNIMMFVLGFTFYFIMTAVSQLWFGRSILFQLSLIPMLILVSIIYLGGVLYERKR